MYYSRNASTAGENPSAASNFDIADKTGSALDDASGLETATGRNLAQNMTALRNINARNYVLSLDRHRWRQGDRPDRHGRYLIDQILEDSVDGFACNWHFSPAPAQKAAPRSLKFGGAGGIA
jgi:hypothetical protein